MKTFFALLLVLVSSASVSAMDSSPGYLVFTIDRAIWRSNELESSSFKILLSKDFLAQFKHLPIPFKSSGTGFYCGGGKADSAPSWAGPTAFTWWVRRTSEGRLSINMWGKGNEEINGQHISSHNPSASQYVTFKTWEDIDMGYQLSYLAGRADGLNVGFTVKYHPASDKKLETIPLAPVRKADQSDLIPGREKDNGGIRLYCGFQEG
jgi:hypothetical protein